MAATCLPIGDRMVQNAESVIIQGVKSIQNWTAPGSTVNASIGIAASAREQKTMGICSDRLSARQE